MGKRNPYVASLQAIPKRLAKVKPTKAYELLNEALLIFAASGDVTHAAAVIKLVYESALPRPTKIATVADASADTLHKERRSMQRLAK